MFALKFGGLAGHIHGIHRSLSTAADFDHFGDINEMVLDAMTAVKTSRFGREVIHPYKYMRIYLWTILSTIFFRRGFRPASGGQAQILLTAEIAENARGIKQVRQ
jgi:hypothetical protein